MARSSTPEPEFGETWTYESIVSALPGIDLSDRVAVAFQLALFQVGVFALAAVYDAWSAALVGTAAVIVAAGGSVVMLRMGALVRSVSVSGSYRKLLFGSNVEVVLSVLAFIALVTYLLVVDPRQSATPLLNELFGPEPPMVLVYFALLVCWDLCYRIGASWWIGVVSLWRTLRYPVDSETGATLGQVDLLNVGFGLLQVILVPFVLDHPSLVVALGGHILAVTTFSGSSYLIARSRR
ncbi:DUF7530 family protein [Halalkalicoccus jeotgali]|uniref:Uncharacterized protein n=1 Tax=Halalkalicoccus jeotgali (strain DSM 18796 / CECT 7217 / JCM 14584 / KCTC 4019 / B3) TaxID=795797 RepID=D8J560_HALJB|nr:hypothetical protein [Halalkalicoccus jeotgali]ADJ13641.1 hypothetical protein HacjB3_01240 [Halalkalicoccus jeotgali B3]ELY33337.1 hypothetical protein C497_18092 [Halalkalicoccus jeotgali B3]